MVALTTPQYEAIVSAIRDGYGSTRPNPKVATALVAEANLGIRIGDILRLRLCDFIFDGDRIRLDITEEKTGKTRRFTVPQEVYDFLRDYARARKIADDAIIFPFSSRAVQIRIKDACEHLGFTDISTHSFRKWYATDIYNKSGHDLALVQHLLQHSSPVTTRRYIGIDEDKVEEAIANHVHIA